VKVFGKWGSAVAEAMAGQGGEENLFSKRFLPHKTVLQHPPLRIISKDLFNFGDWLCFSFQQCGRSNGKFQPEMYLTLSAIHSLQPMTEQLPAWLQSGE